MGGKLKHTTKKVETPVDPEDDPSQQLCDDIEELVDSFIQL